jgi:hypothetical protein
MDTHAQMLCETDADEVDIILAGGDPGIAESQSCRPRARFRGDILADSSSVGHRIWMPIQTTTVLVAVKR